jgi:uncharacterized protein
MSSPQQRSYLAGLVDYAYTWYNSLPPATASYTTQAFKIQVPKSPNTKSIHLTANLYLTTLPKPHGTLLIRTPYGISPGNALGSARFFAARGYHVLLNACRGTAGSDGDLVPGHNERADGLAVVDWMRAQDWYTGSFAMLGGSYLGYTQWALIGNEGMPEPPPQDMVAACIFTGPHSFYNFTWTTGALDSNVILWADVAQVFGSNLLTVMRRFATLDARIKPAFDSVPLTESLEKHFGGNMPVFVKEPITQSGANDSYWAKLDSTHAPDRINIPVLLVAGWYDILLPEVMAQYRTLRSRGVPVALTVGPWTHLGAQMTNIPKLALPWLEEHLAGHKDNLRQSNVTVNVTGSDVWREMPTWPPETRPLEYHLQPSGVLNTAAPSEPSQDTEPATSFTFNPANPTPATGLPLFFARSLGTSNDATPLLSRADVLSFTTAPLTQALEILGQPSISLHHSTTTPHADLLILLAEIDSTGTAKTISHVYQRLNPAPDITDDATGPKPRELRLHDIAHRFARGNRLALLIAGGAHPRFLRNLGTGESQAAGVEMVSVEHRVWHCAERPSKLVLPVLRT